MIAPTFKADLRGLDAEINRKVARTGRDLATVVNQAAFNVAARSFHATPPKTWDYGQQMQPARMQVRDYLREQLATYIKRFTSGKRKGKTFKFKARNKELRRVHLILNARRGREGKPGLYGKAMLRASGAFVQRAQVSVGYLKSVWLPVMRGLWPLVKFRGLWRGAHRVARWANSAGSGVAQPAKPGSSVTAVLSVTAKVKGTQDAKVAAVMTRAVNEAVTAETAEMARHAAKVMSAP